jgi:predicted small metal-binding protein
VYAIDCPCGHHFQAETEEELFRLCRAHVDNDHPELERTDDELRARIAADGYRVEAASQTS